MKFFGKLAAFFVAAFLATAAYGQSAGTVVNHAFAIGKGPGVTGYASLLCASAQLAVGQTAADPICRTVTGDWTLNAAGVSALATVNANVGSFGSATQCTVFTVNAKGLITAASQTACTVAIGSVSGLGAGVATALGVNVGTAGAPVVQGGALGTPSSGVGTNLTGTAAGLIAGGLTGARTTPITIQRFTAAGPGTYTTPANVLWIEIEGVGPGGGGGAVATNSGAAGASNTCWALSGAACTTPVLLANSGLGGAPSAGGTAGGTASGGNVYNVTGGDSFAYNLLGASQAVGGNGGNSCRGGGARGGVTAGGAAASNTGGGGGGGGQVASNFGGAGGGGGGCFKHIINNPAASYTYNVGPGGLGGAAGTNAGGNGGSGEIDVIEHYN